MIENLSNDSMAILTQVLEEMKQEKGSTFVLQHVNLSELERRTGISRKKLRNLRDNDFKGKAPWSSGFLRLALLTRRKMALFARL